MFTTLDIKQIRLQAFLSGEGSPYIGCQGHIETIALMCFLIIAHSLIYTPNKQTLTNQVDFKYINPRPALFLGVNSRESDITLYHNMSVCQPLETRDFP